MKKRWMAIALVLAVFLAAGLRAMDTFALDEAEETAIESDGGLLSEGTPSGEASSSSELGMAPDHVILRGGRPGVPGGAGSGEPGRPGPGCAGRKGA